MTTELTHRDSDSMQIDAPSYDQVSEMNAIEGSEEKSIYAPPSYSIFSWRSPEDESELEDMFSCMTASGIDTVYQYFSMKLETESYERYMSCAYKYGVDVYFLTGEPEWGTKKDDESLKEAVKKIASINDQMPDNCKFVGIVMDAEPYLTSKWDKDKEKVMKRYTNAMIDAYETAKDNNLEYVACIPYFYDTKGLGEYLEKLIKDGCSGIAVMNYYRGKEIEHIRNEFELAQKYSKVCITIFELQSAESRGVEPQNTYWSEGLNAVYEQTANMQIEFNDEIGFALHEYEDWRELIKNE